MVRLSFLRDGDLNVAVAAVREVMARHGVAALPTETFYGLAADPRDERAVARIYAIKGREADKGLPVVGATLEQLEDLVVIQGPRRALLQAAWPAPLTVVLPARKEVAASPVSLAVRVCSHGLLQRLLARVGPLTATSANLSGAPPNARADDVAAILGSQIDLLLDGGETPGGVPTTLVEWLGASPRVLRQGAWSVPDTWVVKPF